MKAIEAVKELEAAVTLEQQMETQRRLLALISFVPDFKDYAEKENINQVNFYPPKPTVDHAFARWFLNDPNFEIMEDLQYQQESGMFAEAMAGISLVKASVDFIKSNIETAKDIGEIAGAVDSLFKGQEEIEKKRSRKAGYGVADQFGIKTVAQEVIDAKLAQEKMDEMRQLIDFRFGHGTWKSIVDERAKRIQEEKDRIEAERKKRIQKEKETEEFVKKLLVVFGGIAAVVGVILAAIGFI